MPGNVYVNICISAIAEILAYIGSGILVKYLSIKWSFLVAFGLATLGGLLMSFINTSDDSSQSDKDGLVATFVLFAKFGISFAFNIVYLGTPMLFPTILVGTAFGICNVVARFTTILSPLIAEVSPPWPMLIFAALSAVSGVLSLTLRSVKIFD